MKEINFDSFDIFMVENIKILNHKGMKDVKEISFDSFDIFMVENI